jgi:hypothetical protein
MCPDVPHDDIACLPDVAAFGGRLAIQKDRCLQSPAGRLLPGDKPAPLSNLFGHRV